jgi:hypothetical protein
LPRLIATCPGANNSAPFVLIPCDTLIRVPWLAQCAFCAALPSGTFGLMPARAAAHSTNSEQSNWRGSGSLGLASVPNTYLSPACWRASDTNRSICPSAPPPDTLAPEDVEPEFAAVD